MQPRLAVAHFLQTMRPLNWMNPVGSCALAGFLAEDVGRGDRTTEAIIPHGAVGRAFIQINDPGVVAGLEVARSCFEAQAADGEVRWVQRVSDGDTVIANTRLAEIAGSLRAILAAERTALNLLSRLSGVSTSTALAAMETIGTSARIVDTRKTTPGLRSLEKYAVRMGGGYNHRFGLDDGVLIKDNHIIAAGGVKQAVNLARSGVPHGLLIQIEVDSIEQLDEALEAGADAVLLDNMNPELVRQAVVRTDRRAILEASGGITLANVRHYAETGVDLISIGALTHSPVFVDISLTVNEKC